MKINRPHIEFLISILFDHLSIEAPIGKKTIPPGDSDKIHKFCTDIGYTPLKTTSSFRNIYNEYIGTIRAEQVSGRSIQNMLESQHDVEGFFNLITLYFFGKKISDWIEENSFNNSQRKDIFSEMYFRKLYKTFSETDNSENMILNKIMKNNNLSENDLNWFLGVIPELFLNSSIRYEEEKDYFGIYDRNSHYVSNPILFNGDKRMYGFDGKNSRKILSKANNPVSLAKEVSGIYMIHGLSPIDDSLFLLCEIGRFAKIAAGLKAKKGEIPIDIICVDQMWSTHNNSLNELKHGLEIDFKECEKKRKIIYNRILKSLTGKEDFEYSRMSEVGHNSLTDGDPHSNILNEIKEYFDFANSEELLNDIKKKIPSIIPSLENSTNFIKNIKNKFIAESQSIDENTLKYVIFQRYLQLKYKNYLKVGIFREFDFDDTFNQLNSTHPQISNEYNFYGIYFQDYFVKWKNTKENYIKMKIHPYFYPSGNFYKTIKEKYQAKGLDFTSFNINDGTPKVGQTKHFNSMMKELNANTILLSDHENKSKILELISRYSMRELSTIISDLLCFVFYFFNKNESTEIVRYANFGNEFISLWKKSYASIDVRKNIYKDHFENFLAFSYNTTKVPFYFFPYIFSFDELKDQEKQYKEKYSLLIEKTLSKIQNVYETY